MRRLGDIDVKNGRAVFVDRLRDLAQRPVGVEPLIVGDYFYYVNSTSGSINQTIQIVERGHYTLSIVSSSCISDTRSFIQRDHFAEPSAALAGTLKITAIKAQSLSGDIIHWLLETTHLRQSALLAMCTIKANQSHRGVKLGWTIHQSPERVQISLPTIITFPSFN